jgi:hypothetical protein
MRLKTVFFALLAVAAVSSSAFAGWRGGGGYCGPRGGWGGGWGGGGYCGPRFGGWYGPAVSVGVWVPPPTYTTVVYRSRSVEPVYGAGRSMLAQAQVKLARRGYYDGDIDGVFGPQTSRALRLYQAENGLPITGRLDSRTLGSLGV